MLYSLYNSFFVNVVRKGKIQEETEENVGWLLYTKEKDQVYMKKPGALQCPKCKPAPSHFINDIKKIIIRLVYVTL